MVANSERKRIKIKYDIARLSQFHITEQYRSPAWALPNDWLE